MLVGLGILCGGWAGSEADDRERALAEMLRLLPRSPAWEEWQRRTGEFPPDFSLLPTRAELPDPLRFEDGRRVRSRQDWLERRRELLGLFARYVTGTVPPPPGNVAPVERNIRAEAGAIVERVVLGFGPDRRARLRLELILPPGGGPRPVFLTQDNHRRWALVAVSRGYIGAVYAGADSADDTAAWGEIWPAHDWTKLTRRAWAASRCVDYLNTRPEVDVRRIAVTGHSRNGKTSLIAAALDERIAAVISSSSGAGGACTYRLFSEIQFGEGIELITRQFPDWLHPRLRFFVGREHKLPIDQHELIACIAPRPCLISTALNDNVESVWAIEKTIEAVQPVFAWLAAPRALAARYRPGGHPTRAEDIESYLDWLDGQWGQGRPGGRGAREEDAGSKASPAIYPTYADWRRLSGDRTEAGQFPPRRAEDVLVSPAGEPIEDATQWELKRQDIRDRLGWLLGEAPPQASDLGGEYGAESRAVAALLNRGSVREGLHKESLNFGNYLAGDLYYPTNVLATERRLPAFLWIHPISVSHGYVPGYFRGEPPHVMMSRTGYAVFAFDQIGNGSRVEEVRGFYQRYPRWSLLGKTVADVRAAVDVLVGHPRIDPAQIYLVGYATGGMAALCAAALDDRVAGVIAVAAFTPMRTDTADKGTGGVGRWSRALPLLPRLGAFVGAEARIPCDYEEILASIAPRPALVITPGIDGQSTFDDVRQCVSAARRVYELLGSRDALVFQRTDDYNHFSPDLLWCLCGVETIR